MSTSSMAVAVTQLWRLDTRLLPYELMLARSLVSFHLKTSDLLLNSYR